MLARCVGHSAAVAHLDWSMPLQAPKELIGRSVLKSNCSAYEILHWDPMTGKKLRHNMRDAQVACVRLLVSRPFAFNAACIGTINRDA